MAAVVRRVQRFRLRHLAQTRLWLLPLTCVLAGIGLAVALLSVDRSIVGTAVTGSAASVQTILTVASTALVTLTSVVFADPCRGAAGDGPVLAAHRAGDPARPP